MNDDSGVEVITPDDKHELDAAFFKWVCWHPCLNNF